MLKKMQYLLLLVVASVFQGHGFNEISTDIPELKYINKSVDPCEDFYEFTCGNFKNVRPKPDDEEIWDDFIILKNELQNTSKLILTSEPVEEEPISLKKAKAAYTACLDLDFADKLIVPEVAILSEANGWPLITEAGCAEFSWSVVGNLVAKYGVPLFFDIGVVPNLIDARQLVIKLDVAEISKLHIPRKGIRPYFSDNVDRFLDDTISTRSEHPFVTFITTIAMRLRKATGSFKKEEKIKQDLDKVMEFIQKIDKITTLQGTVMFFKTIEELQTWTDNVIGKDLDLNWLQYLRTVFSKSGVEVQNDTWLVVYSDDALTELLQLLKESKDSLLQDFVLTRLFTITAPDSNTDIRKAYETFRADMGDKYVPRSDYCIQKIIGDAKEVSLSMAVTYAYQRYHFDLNKMENASRLWHHVTDAFLETVKFSEWMDNETEANALKKINKMLFMLGYPDFVEEPRELDNYYKNLRVCTWDHFGNAQRLRAFNQNQNFALLGKARDRSIWSMSPLTVNAFYNVQSNRIMFPISMLSDIFFRGNMRALDFGRIGMVIAHEITHGYDSQGKMYDGDGSFQNWWSPETNAEYKKRSECFINQYSRYYIPEVKEYVNGVSTLRENLADNGGLKDAHSAFMQLLQRGLLGQVPSNYTQEQLFFIGFGTMWCTTETNEYLMKLQNQSYPPARYRVRGAVSNNIAFSRAFDCPTNSRMNPKEKCTLW